MRDRSLCLHKRKKKMAKPMRKRERERERETDRKGKRRKAEYICTYVRGRRDKQRVRE